MNQNLPQVQPKGVALKDAWFVFAPSALQDRMSQLAAYKPSFAPSASTLEKVQVLAHGFSEIGRLQEAKKEAVEHLRGRLAAGDLSATGLPPPTDGKFRRVPIEDAFWDAATIDPAAGSASAMGVEYVAVQVFGARPAKVEIPEQSERAQQKAAAQPRAPLETDFPATGGATSYEDIRAEAVLYCFRTYRDFEKVKLKRRLEMVIDYVDTNHPEIDTSWGFDRSSFYSTVRKLRDAGKLPSNNVQQ